MLQDENFPVMVLLLLMMSSLLLGGRALKSDACRSKTIKYYADKPFTPCINLYAGHDIYFCPVPEPRLCIEPIPSVVKFQSKPHQEREPLKDKTYIWPDDSTIPYANMTRIKSRVTDRTKDSIFPRDCLECWDYAPTSRYWSTFIDSIEEAAGFKFTNGPVRTVLDFGCGSGGFLGEMAVRGVTGICTAREVTNKEGNETYLPYLRTDSGCKGHDSHACIHYFSPTFPIQQLRLRPLQLGAGIRSCNSTVYLYTVCMYVSLLCCFQKNIS